MAKLHRDRDELWPAKLGRGQLVRCDFSLKYKNKEKAARDGPAINEGVLLIMLQIILWLWR